MKTMMIRIIALVGCFFFIIHGFSWEAFKYAMLGKQSLEENTNFSKPNILTIIDFSKPSTEERLFVVDLKELKILIF